MRRSELAAQALENLRRLAAHHLPEMAREHQRALLLFADGKTYAQIAAFERASESTVKQRLSAASAEIGMCLATGQVTASLRGGWAVAHFACCLQEEVARLAEAPA